MRSDIRVALTLCLLQALFGTVASNAVAYNPGPCTTCGQAPPQPQPCTTCGGGGIVIIPQPCVTCGSPEAGAWGPWSDWSLCEQQFGAYSQTRQRQCLSGNNCPGGSSSEARPCLTFQDEPPTTPRSLVVGEWAPWSQCSASCGRGYRSRQRQCTFSDGAPAPCNAPTSEQEVCDMGTCCQWTSWMAWSECSVTCGGGGVRYRTRQCTCDRDCPNGPVSEQQPCNGARDCPPTTPSCPACPAPCAACPPNYPLPCYTCTQRYSRSMLAHVTNVSETNK